MITAIIFILVVFILITAYVYLYKGAGINMIFMTGLIFGFGTYKEHFDDGYRSYIDLYLGFMIISVYWDVNNFTE